jgi:hypothetical protein
LEAYRASDIEEMVSEHLWMFQYYLVAQTEFHPFNKSEAAIERAVYGAERDLNYVLNCLASEVNAGHVSRAKRKPHIYRPASFASVECTDAAALRHKTLHFNLLLGNLPAILTASDIKAIFRHYWVGRAGQADDVSIQAFDGRNRLIGYTLKESKKANDADGVWSYMNTHIPSAPAFADRG